MRPTTNLLLTLITISIFPFFTNGTLQPQHQHAHGGGCNPDERAALLSFKEGITSNNTNLLASWKGQDCCRWRGVSCCNQTGHVIKLHLRNPNVTLDAYGYDHACASASALFGEISPSLLSLKHLKHLDLSMNCLLGPNSQIPHLLGSMGNLRYLNLSGIPFTGRVPSHLGNLSKMQYLDLGQAGDYSDMYSMDITWLTKLPFLKFLGMSGVNLSGIADWPHTLNMIPPLRVIDLSYCLLDSANQSLLHLNLTKLEKLDLSWNFFKHSLGSGWFWKVTSLKYLHLEWNLLFGKFPDTLGNMTYLRVLDISYNGNPDMMMTGNIKKLCSLEILDLSGNRINGDIESLFVESLPQCTRKNLQKLDLSYNNFTGTLPNIVSDFSKLSILSLSNNNLVGPIPAQLGNLTCLTSLDLFWNHLNGSIPPELGALTTLTSLDLSMNDLTGSIPAELGNLRYLSELCLSDNNITAPIPPELMNSTSLTHLDLSSNHLNGSVPTEIGSLNNLIYLYLSNNRFTGVITEENFANLTSLKDIDLSFNNLKIVLNSDWRAPFTLEFASFASCQMGPLFPPGLQRLKTNALDISNTTLKGEIPDWFWSTFSNATYLDISNNQISGSLPAHMHSMAFEKLHLGSNRLTGPIPTLPTNITLLDISNNTFSETIPSNLGASRLEILSMHSNQIGGYIPESICKLEQLLYLDLSNNILEGEVPHCFHFYKIEHLILSNNSLSGKIPAFLQNNTGLQFLDVSWNRFSGRLPTWIGNLVNLRFLVLSHNIFSDNIPVDITKLGHLQYLDLSRNNFSGGIPCHMSNLTFMSTLQSMYMVEVTEYDTTRLGPIFIEADRLGQILSVNTKGQQLIYHGTLAYFVSIDLSCNSLTGEIPTDITSLAALMNLNLSSNQLSGQIPSMIGAMQSLVSLDLSQNKLSGEIPSSLSNLTSLSYMNLSCNSLSGRIPSGPQLDILNLDNQSLIYIGNTGLCGPPVHKNCSGNDPYIHSDLESSKEEFDPLTFYFGLVLGFVVGLWMVFCALLFKKTWRIAYFRFFDKVYDQVYVFVVVKWASFAKNTPAE
ncbi:receptor-like protein EIX2 [Aegilops tauschii subsp. strangulata]|uniref:Leucine-rich repeat-containing N-terminal plant-type domain-containing protein n=2 Tax=Aegilops tauschii TaxID=37682 RepID=A0A453DSW8_AEGTS|nr:receptor-like protein EIX2 [Aegilops tauschii subsp. strangulata]